MQTAVRVGLTVWVTSGQMTVFNGGGCRWASQCSKHHACKHVHDVHDLDTAFHWVHALHRALVRLITSIVLFF
jgi:hypothetical protein